jgi:hypothetical protein
MFIAGQLLGLMPVEFSLQFARLLLYERVGPGKIHANCKKPSGMV